MPTHKPKWTPVKIKSLVKELRVSSVTDWKSKHVASYQAAVRLKIQDEIRIGLPDANQKWTFETVLKEAENYETVSDWKRANPQSYEAARDHGWLNEVRITVFAGNHSFAGPRKWTRQVVYNHVREQDYNTVTEWQKDSRGSYQAARSGGYLDEVKEVFFE